jgi:PEGA domain
MRSAWAVIVMLALPAVAVAQSPASATGAVPRLPSIGLPLPSIGLPLPSIGLPLPTIGLPPATDSQRRANTGRPSGLEDQHFRRNPHRRPRSRASVVYFVPAYDWGYPQPGLTAPPAPYPDAPPVAEPALVTGRLRLDLQVDSVAQLYVDGYYVGTWEDFNGELELEAGPHTIEIRASGYEPLALDVKIAPNRAITYRGALKPSAVRREPDAAPLPEAGSIEPQTAPRTTIYFIPGCYLGNVPPDEVKLPATCDRSRMIVRTP